MQTSHNIANRNSEGLPDLLSIGGKCMMTANSQAADGGGFQLFASRSKKQIPIVQKSKFLSFITRRYKMRSLGIALPVLVVFWTMGISDVAAERIRILDRCDPVTFNAAGPVLCNPNSLLLDSGVLRSRVVREGQLIFKAIEK